MEMGQCAFWTNDPCNFPVYLSIYLDKLRSGNQDNNTVKFRK